MVAVTAAGIVLSLSHYVTVIHPKGSQPPQEGTQAALRGGLGGHRLWLLAESQGKTEFVRQQLCN